MATDLPGVTRRSAAFGTQATTVLGLGVIAAYLAALGWGSAHLDYDWWGALLVAPFLLAATVPVARSLARHDGGTWIARLVLVACALKLVASVLRFAVAFEVYDGAADAASYIAWGELLSHPYRHGDFLADAGTGGSGGTIVVRRLTGLVFAVLGPSAVGGFMVFAWAGFLGLCCCYRAFQIAVPDGDRRRYALLLFLLPSLLYWPSSIGKDAWMMLCLGLGALGVARVLTGLRSGYAITALGVGGAALVRPHLAVLLCASLAVGAVVRARYATGTGTGTGSPLRRLAGVAIVALALAATVQQAQTYFGVGEGAAGAEAVLHEAEERTATGGSEFEAQRPSTPLQLPGAAFAVLFRPLPHEAQNLQMLIASIEGLALLTVVGWSWRRLASVPRSALRRPFIAFAVTYVLLFVLAFSGFGNFGILARQRAQVFPFLLVMLAVPAPPSAVDGDRP